jgi:four helix bundle protein
MKENNIILEKTFGLGLGLRIIKLFKHLRKNKVERDLCLQLINSGTSAGANVEEAIQGSSRKDFIHKMEIAYREARETRYWVGLFKKSDLFKKPVCRFIYKGH